MKKLLFGLLLLFAASAAIGQQQNNNGAISGLDNWTVVEYRVVSVANTQQIALLDLHQAHDTLAISSVCSAGTAALTVESSTDNSNFITIDSITAAAANVKQYTATTVGATTALSPLSFRFLRITTATCGASNTSTLIASAK